jgi:enoyl-[acyl-carrier-protein] reductase (NADH)
VSIEEQARISGTVAVFLCSPVAVFVTSTVLQIDGGIQATNLPVQLPDL